jgi:23S rRNA A2030 N6-methylase RlmJ
VLVTELFTRAPIDPNGLNGCGLSIFNPPFTLAERLSAALPELTRRMAVADGAFHVVDTRCPPRRPRPGFPAS